MEHCMDGYQDWLTVPYLDDLMIYSATFQQHLEHLQLAFKRVKRHAIKVKASKWHLFKREILYLGQIISSAGCRADLKAVSSKLKMKPSTITELRTILGLVRYSTRSISTSPLYQILNDTQNKQRRSKEPTDWNDNHQAALDKLLHHLVADTLSRLPINNAVDLQAFSGLCSVDEVRATFDGAGNQAQNGDEWLPKRT